MGAKKKIESGIMTKIDIFRHLAVSEDDQIDTNLFDLISSTEFFNFLKFCDKVQKDSISIDKLSCTYTETTIKFKIN